MANTYTALYFHIVFSTKNRAEFIQSNIEERIWAYLGGVARHHKISPIQIGGIEDHLHALVAAPPTLAPFEIAKYLKGDSSRWIREEFPDLLDFGWQDGYAAFTISKSNVPRTASYIKDQRAHHQKQTFQEEYLEFLKKHEVPYDERYIWG